MTQFPIPAKVLVKAVREVVAENPDHVYKSPEGCVYFNDDGTPSCGVGHGFARLGIKPDDLTEDCNGSSIGALRQKGLITGQWESDESQWLSEFQVNQDLGTAWGESAQLADEEAARYRAEHA